MFLEEITTIVPEYTTQGNFNTINCMQTGCYFLYRDIFNHVLKVTIISRFYRLERHDMFDMIPILFDTTILIARPTPLDMDFGLLIRPYRTEAWIMVGVTVASFLAFLIFPSFCMKNFSKYARYV